MRSAVLLVLIGVFVIARTVIKDDAGENLVDRILGANTKVEKVNLNGVLTTNQQVADALAQLIEANKDAGGTTAAGAQAAQGAQAAGAAAYQSARGRR
ncbi:hypothetical protein GKE82_05895 [Conexibacter sp. W3-3-2]|uniref:hypothetical protein n=1 Tax=Conexibacter sp. W3-3-2 TaxID=2675227 RepID=UPI0012B82CED|nr:hypothetical protein [Conexibacter sp. W3-3-2]MTD43848.1 hypothetical protein [Conexibacter sp. W3-3-2]